MDENEDFRSVLAFGGAIEGQLYMWGGQLCSDHDAVEVFDPCTDEWQKIKNQGDHPPPPPLSVGASAVSGQYLYIYGGIDSISGRPTGYLYQYDTRSSAWTKLSGPERAGSPRGKIACAMVHYDEGKLLLFGGCDYYLARPGVQPGASYEDRATNEQHVFSINEGKWSSPDVTGARPPPLFGFTLTKTSSNQAVLLGGKNSHVWNHHVYLLQLDTSKWKRLDTKPEEECSSRLFHSTVCIGYGGPSPKLLLVGGLPFTHSEVWMFDVEGVKWNQLSLPVSLGLERHGHFAAAFEVSSSLTDVVIGGGSIQHDTPVSTSFSEYKNSHCVLGTTVLVFGGVEQSLQELCSSVIKSALMHQKDLKPSQLADRLPEYVPTRIKQWITRQFSHLVKSSVIHYFVDRDWFYNYSHVCFNSRHKIHL